MADDEAADVAPRAGLVFVTEPVVVEGSDAESPGGTDCDSGAVAWLLLAIDPARRAFSSAACDSLDPHPASATTHTLTAATAATRGRRRTLRAGAGRDR